MDQRKVVWTETASVQLRLVLQYWIENNDSTHFAEKLLNEVETTVRVITQFPESFPETTFTETRAASLNHYSIFYKALNKVIIITAFWDNRQDPKTLLELLKTVHNNG